MPGTSVALDTVEILSKFLSNKFSLSQAWRQTKVYSVWGLFSFMQPTSFCLSFSILNNTIYYDGVHIKAADLKILLPR